MRMTLQNYLSMADHTIDDLAHQLGRSRETIRRWRNDKKQTSFVEFEGKKVAFLELGTTKKIMAVAS